jgi:putative membrane protein
LRAVVALLALAAVAIVAFLHLAFFVLESFLWTKPVGRRIFGLTRELAESSKALAANQGLYNAFLAAGLIWGLVPGEHAFGVKVFFLSCVVIAGIVGAMTAKRSILFVQAFPGAVALLLVLLAKEW